MLTQRVFAETITYIHLYYVMHIQLYVFANIVLHFSIQFVVHRVRLVDGPNPRTGRVEVYTNSTGGLDNGEWGAICGDYWWDFWNAMVVCNQLGYPDVVVDIRYGRYGEGIGPYWLYRIQCLGTETDIFTCTRYGIENHFCSYGSAAVECLGMFLSQNTFSYSATVST